MKFSYLWLQSYFNEPLPAPQKLAELLTFHSFEVESVSPDGDDSIFEIAILPNRRHDCLSHRGIAREVSVITGIPLARDPFYEKTPEWNTAKEFTATVGDSEGCPRYMAAYMRGVRVEESPDWLKKRLSAVGQKPINNIVDVTNYVMFELGQPLHAFDAERFEKRGGAARIGVRSAKERELITLLGGEERVLADGDLVITDDVSGSPVGIAGIKGGLACEITARTKNIIIESANFTPARVRATATRLGLRTDASLRFESGLAPEQAAYAMKEVIMLIEKLTGATLLGVHDEGDWKERRTAIPLSADEVNKLIGTDMNDSVLLDVLNELNFPHKKNEDEFVVTPPFERLDVLTKEDLIEEVGRVYGYEKISTVPLPQADKSPAVNKNFYYAEKIRDILIAEGFSEVYTHAIGSKGEVELENPLAEDKKFLRVSLKNELEKTCEKAAMRAEALGLSHVRIFEMGGVFDGGETPMLGIAVRNVSGKQEADEELRRTLVVLAKELQAGKIEADASADFSRHKSIFQMPLDTFFEKLPVPSGYVRYQKPVIEPRFHPISPYPFVLRDIAVFVPESTESEETLAVIRNEAGSLLARARLFDEFKKDGKISYAFRLVFQSHEKTLNDTEVNEIMTRIANALNSREGFSVR